MEKTIYDESGNQIDDTEFLNELLKDELIPTIYTVSHQHNSYIDLRKPTIMKFGFNEQINTSNIVYTVTSRYASTVPFESILDDKSIIITLSPRVDDITYLTSFDSISVQFDYLELCTILRKIVSQFLQRDY